jgi:hypothetical protein
MTRLPRFLPSLALACTLAGPVVPLFAQDAPKPADAAAPKPADAAAPAPAPAPAPAAADATPATAEVAIDPALRKSVEDFWYYASIGKYDLAKAEGDKITASDKPEQVFLAFQAVVADRNRFLPTDRHIELFDRVLSWQRVPELKDTAVKILDQFKKAQQTRRTDTAFIEEQVKRLGGNRRAYSIAVENLRESGELAVPVMIKYLRDPQFKDLRVPIRNALRDMERRGLAPLLAATEMKDWDTLVWVVGVLGDLRYDAATPYLARLLQAKDTPQAVKDASVNALMSLGVNDPLSLNAAQLFFDQGERYFYDKGAVRPAPGETTAMIWSWVGDTLSSKPVPAQTYHDDTALKCLEACLQLDASRGDAVSLWIDSGFQREAQIPEGASDAFWAPEHPATAFYATSSGTKHLNPALSRALRDRNTPVALKAIASLQNISGGANLFTGEEDRPLMDAMRYPDRQVRFEAAFAVAGSMPTRQFVAQERVVPILAEALAQSGKAGVLVLGPSQDDVNKIVGAVSGNAAYVAKGGASPDAAIAAMTALPGVDVIILEAGDKNIDQMIQGIDQQPRLERAARLVLLGESSEVASPWATIAATNPIYTVSKAKIDDQAGLGTAIEEARKRSGNLPLDEKTATSYALRAAGLLGQLALTRGQVLDLAPAQSALLGALEDARPEIVKASGAALAYINAREAQTGLIVKGMDEKTPDEIKIALLDDLATNARTFGNQLDPALIDSLLKVMQGAATNEVKAAASRAYGALNLNSDQVKNLILNQSGK